MADKGSSKMHQWLVRTVQAIRASQYYKGYRVGIRYTQRSRSKQAPEIRVWRMKGKDK